MPKILFSVVACVVCGWFVGCHNVVHPHRLATLEHAMSQPPPANIPRELAKVSLEQYTIEPPDILVVEGLQVVPRDPYLLKTGDVLDISVAGTPEDAPIKGEYSIQPGGHVNLGVDYGSIQLRGLTVQAAEKKIFKYLEDNYLQEPKVSLSLKVISGQQQISGQHLVGPDGTITLGAYGSISVVGMTLAQAKASIEKHLAQYLEDPEVAVDVYAYNSKVYYIITEGGGLGDSITRFPITGNETVLDAISNINGLTSASSKKIWIARPVPNSCDVQILPVDWQAVTETGVACSNYQIMPGDRVFVAEDDLVAMDSRLAKIFAPWERTFGFTLLTAGTATRLSGKVLQGGGARNAGSNAGAGGFGF
jgi:polysaccharide biosynthesis/export protein